MKEESNLKSFRWLPWTLPLFAIAIVAWLFYQDYSNRGPMIEISFHEAAGMEELKTPVRFRGVVVGQVKEIGFDKDSNQVLVRARLKSNAAHLAVEGSQFSVVQAEVGLQGISGLDTLFQGSYIKVEQGKSEKAQMKFEGTIPSIPAVQSSESVRYFLRSSTADSVAEGDPVLYRGIPIGRVSALALELQGRWVTIEILVKVENVQLIRTNTLFWRKAAVHADLSLFGAEIEMSSLRSMMKGGIVIATPDDAGELALAEATFDLRKNAPDGFESWKPSL